MVPGDAALAVVRERDGAEGRAGGAHALHLAVGPEREGVGVAGIAVAHLAGCGIHHGEEDGEVHLGALQLVDERVVDVAQNVAGLCRLLAVDGDGAHGQGHDEGGGEPVTGDIADGHAEPAVGSSKRW
jgi:hypothetical protein